MRTLYAPCELEVCLRFREADDRCAVLRIVRNRECGGLRAFWRRQGADLQRKPSVMLKCLYAIFGASAVEAGMWGSASDCNRGRESWRGISGRGRIPAEHERSAALRRWNCALGRSVLLPDSASGREALLGRIFRIDENSGCARPSTMPGLQWRGSLGLRPLRLHGKTGAAAGRDWNTVSRITSQ
jgi:hypothetical protein